MHALSLRPNPNLSALRACAPGPRLTAEEWELILKAVSAYRHNATCRDLYDKLARRKL